MNGEDGARAVGDPALDRGRIHGERGRLGVGEDRQGLVDQDRVVGRDERERGDDHLISGVHPHDVECDRYVSRDAGAGGGWLRTPVVSLGEASDLFVNADVAGELRVRVLDARGAPIPGFDAADCNPVRGDSLRHRVEWKQPLVSMKDKPVQLEFALVDARLYALELRR